MFDLLTAEIYEIVEVNVTSTKTIIRQPHVPFFSFFIKYDLCDKR